ncbi:MAG TPA: nucleotide sugar dehydrogenase [Candidatus Acidoferrales bacterium]
MVKTAAVIGLGRLGAPLAACLASKGVRVIGADADPQKVAALQAGRAPVAETGLESLIHENRGRLSATASVRDAVGDSEISFIVVSTPSEPSGGFSLRHVLPVCEAIGRALKTKSDFHIVVLTSTVLPGMTGGPVQSKLEELSGKKCGRDFGLCYSPEFIALGSVIHDFMNPDFVLIGESDARSGGILQELYQHVCDSKPAVARMNFANAEITKLAVNTYVTTKISFANMLARICERVPGGNVDIVTAALGLDTRIGGKYLKGAVGYGGPCFPRDNHALAALAREVGATSDLAQATDQFNRAQVQWLASFVEQHAGSGGRVGILGLTYKLQTDVVEEAVGFLLARELISRGIRVNAYDPAGMANARLVLGDSLQFASSAEECIRLSDLIVVATPWKEFIDIPAEKWGGVDASAEKVVVDCWRALKLDDKTAGVRYIGLGLSQERTVAAWPRPDKP